jgi:glycosyltransferase involved in cell wall biosynthesis
VVVGSGHNVLGGPAAMPRVDIIIPAYNAAHYLPAALASVVRQTFTDWRILLVDDGSEDNTAEVVAPFRDQLGDKLVYIRQPNAGLPAARNTAIRHSSAELLALLDADDVWLECRLAESVKRLDGAPETGLAYGLVTMIDPAGAMLSTFAGNPAHAEGRIAPHIYMRTVDLPCPTITFRRSCVEEIGMFDEGMRATEDRDLWLRIALRYEVACIPLVLALYRVSPASMSADLGRMLKAQRHFIAKHYGAPGCGVVARQVALARVYKQQAEALSARGRLWPAVADAVYAVCLYPLDGGNIRTAGSLVLRALRAGRMA